MASYTELFSLMNDEDLCRKIAVSVGIAADAIRTELVGTTNHDNRLKWAKQAFENPKRTARQVQWSVIVANKDSTVAQITGATDAQIQANVDAVIDVFADGSINA